MFNAFRVVCPVNFFSLIDVHTHRCTHRERRTHRETYTQMDTLTRVSGLSGVCWGPVPSTHPFTTATFVTDKKYQPKKTVKKV
eukprot:TRINITY_DN2753_c0_g1_i1.p1 TRINITY_DN2753_c0_g1~~TRINITY_DN2753_c0_g1_i1.p1  ORF type:complete len:83 (-),score=1.79 TRINITY_DN2753_c0_g1_i1:161-409(-)